MTSSFKPMLSGTVEDIDKLEYPLYVSPKLDGIRAIVLEGVVVSRNLKPIPNKHVQKLFGKRKYDGLDGELIVGAPTDSDVFRKTTSAVMSEEGRPSVKFYVFDTVRDVLKGHPVEYWSRFNSLLQFSGEDIVPWGTALISVNDPESLTRIEEEWLEAGYEGVMLRSPHGMYKFGRSTLKEAHLLKLKRFEDSEAVVIGWEEQMHNANEAKKDALGRTERSSHKANMKGKNTLGALLVRDPRTGMEFSIGTGFDDATRAVIWKYGLKEVLGRIVKYKFFPTGSKDKPRFPVFQGFRDPIDL